MAIVQVLDKDFTGDGLNAPVLEMTDEFNKIDSIGSNGSLILIDMSKTNELPANGESFTNLFEENAASLTGATTTLQYDYNIEDSAVSQIERTAKGGIYFANRNAIVNPYPNNYTGISCTGGVREYIRSYRMGLETDHDFYFSMWYKVVNPTGAAVDHYIANFCSDSNHNFNRVYYQHLTQGTGNIFSSESIYGYANGVVSAPGSVTPFNVFNGGMHGLNSINITAKIVASSIFYRFYAEDLTVSGRTYDEVAAKDSALATEAFSVGGVFYDDTYTDPSVLDA